MGSYLSRTICALIFAQAFVFGNTLFAQFLVPTSGPEGGLIYGIVEDSAGDIFIMSHGIYKLNPDGESWTRLEHQPAGNPEQFTDLGIDSEGGLYSWSKGSSRMWRSNAEHTTWTRCTDFTGSPLYMSYAKEFVVDQSDRIIVIGDIYTGNETETRPGVCWSDDRGNSWQIADTASLYFYDDLRSLAVDETGLVWVSAYRYNSIDPNQGLYRSNSDFSEWTQIPILGDQSRFVSGLFSGDGCVFANTTDGIFRYDLTGEAWTELTPVVQGDTLRILSVAQDHTVYSSQGDGIYFSEDNGESWTILNDYPAERYDMLFETSDGNRFLGTRYDMSRFSEETASWNRINSGFRGLYISNIETTSSGDILIAAKGHTCRSSDLGVSWEDVFDDKSILSVINGDPDVYFAREEDVVYRSDDNGMTWTVAFTEPVRKIVETINGTMIAVGDGVWRSTDRGLTWHETSDGLLVPGSTYTIYEVVNTNGVILLAIYYRGPYAAFVVRSTDDGLTWHRCPGLPDDLYYPPMWSDPSGSFYVIHSATNVREFKRSDDGGETWVELASPGPYYFDFPDVMTFSPEGVLYSYHFSDDRLFKSIDQGGSWILVESGIPQLNELFVSNEGYLFAGTFSNSVWRSSESVLPAVPETKPLPTEFTLYQNYPNPFNSTTNFAFNLPATGPVTMQIFDITGRLAATPLSGNLTAGHYNINWDANSLASGIYFYRLKTGQQIQTRKLTLLK